MSLNRKDEGRRWSVTRCNRAELKTVKGNEFALFADNVHLIFEPGYSLNRAYSRGFRNSTAASFISPLDSNRRTRA